MLASSFLLYLTSRLIPPLWHLASMRISRNDSSAGRGICRYPFHLDRHWLMLLKSYKWHSKFALIVLIQYYCLRRMQQYVCSSLKWSVSWVPVGRYFLKTPLIAIFPASFLLIPQPYSHPIWKVRPSAMIWRIYSSDLSCSQPDWQVKISKFNLFKTVK